MCTRAAVARDGRHSAALVPAQAPRAAHQTCAPPPPAKPINTAQHRVGESVDAQLCHHHHVLIMRAHDSCCVSSQCCHTGQAKHSRTSGASFRDLSCLRWPCSSGQGMTLMTVPGRPMRPVRPALPAQNAQHSTLTNGKGSKRQQARHASCTTLAVSHCRHCRRCLPLPQLTCAHTAWRWLPLMPPAPPHPLHGSPALARARLTPPGGAWHQR